MAALGAVEQLDAIEDVGSGILPCWVNLATKHVPLEQMAKNLGHGGALAGDRTQQPNTMCLHMTLNECVLQPDCLAMYAAAL